MANSCTNPVYFDGFTRRCQKCDNCISVKMWIKQKYLNLEAAGSKRTWFITLTFKEDRGDNYPEVQKWLKRLRKNTGAKVKYAIVSERGKRNNRFHYHGVLFFDRTVTKRQLPEWSHGFKLYKLATQSSIKYVLKYVFKDGGKLRASANLGKAVIDQSIEENTELLQAFPGAEIISINGAQIPFKYPNTVRQDGTPARIAVPPPARWYEAPNLLGDVDPKETQQPHHPTPHQNNSPN